MRDPSSLYQVKYLDPDFLTNGIRTFTPVCNLEKTSFETTDRRKD